MPPSLAYQETSTFGDVIHTSRISTDSFQLLPHPPPRMHWRHLHESCMLSQHFKLRSHTPRLILDHRELTNLDYTITIQACDASSPQVTSKTPIFPCLFFIVAIFRSNRCHIHGGFRSPWTSLGCTTEQLTVGSQGHTQSRVSRSCTGHESVKVISTGCCS